MLYYLIEQAGLQCSLEVTGVTFYDSAPVPTFLNPSPAILQIWESDSCSDSGYHRSSRNLPMFYLKNDRADSCCCRNGKVTPGPVFHNFWIPGPKEKHRILPESTPDPVPPLVLTFPDPGNSAVFPLNKNDFHLKTALSSNLLQSNINDFWQIWFFVFTFWVRSCFWAVS